MQALPTSATAPEPAAPVFGAVDENGEQQKSETGSKTGSKTGISSLKIKKAEPTNVAGANLQLKTTGVKV